MPTTNPVYISIIIPVFNTSAYLNKCLDSVICQTYRLFEVIIINDGSTDNSLEICEKYKKSDIRIKIISQPNSGISNALNNGISAASGDWLCFVDSDDWIDVNALEGLVNKIKKFPEVDLIRSFCRFMHGNKVKEQNSVPQKDCIYSPIDFIAADKVGGFTHSLFVKRKIVTDNQLKFDTELKIKADMVLNFQCVLNSQYILMSDFVYYNYLIRNDSIIQTTDKNKMLDHLRAPELISEFAKNNNEIEVKKSVKRYLFRGLESYIMACKNYLIKQNKIDFNYRQNIINFINKQKLKFVDMPVRLLAVFFISIIDIRVLNLMQKLINKL